MNNTIIGRNIKEMRLHRNMDEETFAKRCNVDPSIVAQWENDQLAPTCQELYKMAKILHVHMDYFFEDLENTDDGIGFSSECCDYISLALCLLSEIPTANAPRKIILWRRLRDHLLEYKLKRLDTPKYAVKNTTEKQRREVVVSFGDLFRNEYGDVIEGYINGENEISLLSNERLKRWKEYSKKEGTELDAKENTDTWRVYVTCVEYLEKAVENEFVDLRYAAVAVDKLKEYLRNHHESISDIVLQAVYNELKLSCEKNDEENVRKVLDFLRKYGDALWSQLLEDDRVQMSGV